MVAGQVQNWGTLSGKASWNSHEGAEAAVHRCDSFKNTSALLVMPVN